MLFYLRGGGWVVLCDYGFFVKVRESTFIEIEFFLGTKVEITLTRMEYFIATDARNFSF